MIRLRGIRRASQIRGWHRLVVFLAVGSVGLVVQALTLTMLSRIAGWHYLPATGLAVALAVVHNFAWHERWTWADRTARASSGSLGRFAGFIATTGSISMAGNLGFMALYAGLMGLPPLAANLLAIGSVSLANFVVADRWIFRTPIPMTRNGINRAVFTVPAAVLLLGTCVPASAADLRPETIAAWDRYVALTEQRIERDRTHPVSSRDSDRASGGQPLLGGGIPIADMETADPAGRRIDVPAGMIHHWRGIVFIPHVTMDEVLEAAKHPVKQEDVIDLRVIERTTDSLRLYLKLIRRSIVSVTFNTEHDVHFVRDSAASASCRSVATRIAELEAAGTPGGRERPIGRDRGFMWRLNAYWRYERVADGVVVRLESLTLSRDAPMLIGPIVGPIVNHIARESMSRTLESFRQRFVRKPAM